MFPLTNRTRNSWLFLSRRYFLFGKQEGGVTHRVQFTYGLRFGPPTSCAWVKRGSGAAGGVCDVTQPQKRAGVWSTSMIQFESPSAVSSWPCPPPFTVARSPTRSPEEGASTPLPVQDKVEVVRSVTGRLVRAAAWRHQAQAEQRQGGGSPPVPLPWRRPPKLSRHVSPRVELRPGKSAGTNAGACGGNSSCVSAFPAGPRGSRRPAAFRETPQRRQRLDFYMSLSHGAAPRTRRNPPYPEDRVLQNRPSLKKEVASANGTTSGKVRLPSRVHRKLVHLTTGAGFKVF